MDKLKIAVAIIKQEGLYHLQFRNGPKEIGAAGMIGCFGGKIDPGETPLHAITREVAEETNLTPTEDDFEYLGKVSVLSDNDLKPVKIRGRVFKYDVLPGVIIEAREGSLVSLDPQRIKVELDTMTPGTRAAFEQFVLTEREQR